MRSRTFHDLRSAPRDGSTIEVRHGVAQETAIARWSGRSQSWVKSVIRTARRCIGIGMATGTGEVTLR